MHRDVHRDDDRRTKREAKRDERRSGGAAASSGDETASVATVHAAEAMALATRLQALLNIKETVSADHANY